MKLRWESARAIAFFRPWYSKTTTYT
jgi:hypothetical protein